MALAHARAGAGRRPLVLLHGLLGSARTLATLARRLAERDPDLDIVAFDLTGHGESPPLPPGADTAMLAGDVLASVRALGLDLPFAVAGHSLGGRLALRMAALEPASLGVVTLLDIAPGPLAAEGEVGRVLAALLRMPDGVASRGEARALLMAEGLTAELADWLVLNLVPAGEGYRWRVDRRALADLHGRAASEDLWPIVERPHPWALRCVRGGASRYVSDADVRRLEAAGCPVTTIDGAGHLLHIERPQTVADSVAAGLT